MTTNFELFIASKCYCGYLNVTRGQHKQEVKVHIPELCIWCKTLNEYYNQEAAKGGEVIMRCKSSRAINTPPRKSLKFHRVDGDAYLKGTFSKRGGR